MELKKLVVYYSFEGSTKLLSETIAENIGADIEALKPVKEMKCHCFIKYLIGGKENCCFLLS